MLADLSGKEIFEDIMKIEKLYPEFKIIYGAARGCP